ncbi:MAG TPA: hypothetical protein VFT50_15255 [Baekduia sp.]|nr:hypothetical protein [Baekduia sp.]
MRHCVVVSLLALALVPTACGSGVESTGGGASSTATARYAAVLNRAGEGLARRFSALQDGVRPTSTPAADRRLLAAYERAVRAAAAQLRAATPPAGLAALHRRLVAQVEGYGAALRDVSDGLDGADGRAVLAAQGRLARVAGSIDRRIDATIAAIDRKLRG